MLEVKNLSAGYGQAEILHNVDLHISTKEIVAIIGPNGAGKSTLLKSIYNICDVYKGKVEFRGRDITALATARMVKEKLNYVSQGRPVFSELSVRENLEMGAYYKKKNTDLQNKINKVLKQFPFLSSKLATAAYTLSGGQQQLLAIAMAMMQEPDLLLLDEPSLGLAPKTIKEVFELIKKINNSGVSILMVEQNAKQAVSLAHRTYVLEDGRIVLSGQSDILEGDNIRDIYLGGR